MTEPVRKTTVSGPATHQRVTGFSGNEIFCLKKMGLDAGNLCIGNSVFALGVKGSLTAALNIIAGARSRKLPI